MDFVIVVILSIFSLFAVVFLRVAFGLVDSSDESSGPTARSVAIAYTVLGGAVVVGWGLNKIRERLFPSITFAMGQGKRRHENLEKIRWGVVVAFVISLLAGLPLLALP